MSGAVLLGWFSLRGDAGICEWDMAGAGGTMRRTAVVAACEIGLASLRLRGGTSELQQCRPLDSALLRRVAGGGGLAHSSYSRDSVARSYVPILRRLNNLRHSHILTFFVTLSHILTF